MSCISTSESSKTDPHEVLVASYLEKKSTLSSKPLSKNKGDTDTLTESATTYTTTKSNHHRSHHHLWWPKHGESSYWCVLRRSQFSYYKTEDEREAVGVIPRAHILSFRTITEELKLLIYTKEKTMRFKVRNQKGLKEWELALNEFLGKSYESGGNSIDKQELPNKEKTNEKYSHPISNEEEEEEDDDEEYDILDSSKKGKMSKTVNTFKDRDDNLSEKYKSNPDKEFFKTYNPNSPEHIILSGAMYALVKTRFNRTKWKKVKADLTNKSFKLYSFKSSKLKRSFNLDKVIDCVEIENIALDTFFALITIDERLEFKALNEEEMVEWIIDIKSTVLIRDKKFKLNI